MEERFEAFTVLIGRISRSIKRIKSEEMAEFQLKGPHVSCLYYLSMTDGLTAAALCERCDEDKAAVSRCLGQLAEKGLARSEDSGGKRAYRTRHFLTPEGQALAARMNEAIAQALQFGGSGLSDEAREAYYAAAEQILKNLKAYLVED